MTEQSGAELALIANVGGNLAYVASDDDFQALQDAVPANTADAYDRQWRRFTTWCSERGLDPTAATGQMLLSYVRHLIAVPYAPASIEQALGVILSKHPMKPDTGDARRVLSAYRRDRAESGQRQKQSAPLEVTRLTALLGQCDATTAKGLRDRVILLLGFSAMARRSELAKLDVSDVRFVDEGLEILIRASKTDQAGKGTEVAIPYGSRSAVCPVRAVRAWVVYLADQGITEGPLLRGVNRHGQVGATKMTGQGINHVIKTLAEKAGVDHADEITAHSLRAGGATAAAKKGATASQIAAQGRWSVKSPTVHSYIRSANKWEDNAMTGVL